MTQPRRIGRTLILALVPCVVQLAAFLAFVLIPWLDRACIEGHHGSDPGSRESRSATRIRPVPWSAQTDLSRSLVD